VGEQASIVSRRALLAGTSLAALSALVRPAMARTVADGRAGLDAGRRQGRPGGLWAVHRDVMAGRRAEGRAALVPELAAVGPGYHFRRPFPTAT